MTEHEQAILDEALAVEKRIIAEGCYPIGCYLCGIELGEGHHKCRRAQGTDICLECAALYDSPPPEEIEAEMERRFEKREANMNPDDFNHGDIAARRAMHDAGRGR